MENDIASLKQIAEGETGIKTFDYDGQRYSVNDAANLVTQLSAELKELKMEIEHHDKKIYDYFLYQAKQAGKEQSLIAKCAIYSKIKEDFDRRLELHNTIINDTQFLQYTTPFETIEANFENLLPLEKEFKTEIGKIMAEEQYQPSLTDEVKVSFDNYLNNNSSYFKRPDYKKEVLGILYAAVNNFYTVISTTLFNNKKSLLEYQASLQQLVLEAELV